ncbi:glycosyltransferase family 2 protein [Nocardioides sp.]|uniref:glycosyltransferase family 2 protein n=1 Tax=Nocardioides sp. TaxID=35761 RepID=UPI0039E5EB1D
MTTLTTGTAGAVETTTAWPTVSVVIATVDRPVLLRRAVLAALEQRYDGEVEVIVVHDRTEPRQIDLPGLAPGRSVRIVSNRRTPGLAGARNTGILAGHGELVAFCDDDDAWAETKLCEQVELWREHPEAAAIATGIEIRTEDGSHEHLPPSRTRFADLLRSRVLGLHPSAFLIRRADLLGEVGLVDEVLPRSFGEDYDMLLRLARRGDILAVRKPLLMVDWARTSYFDGQWDAISDGLTYLLEKFPEFGEDRRGWARVAGQIAFAHAARSRRGAALRWALATLRRDPRQLRGYGALAVATGLVSADKLVERVQRHGRGL